MNDRAVGNLEKSPASADTEKAVTVEMPLMQRSAETTGARSGAAALSAIAASRRPRLSLSDPAPSRYSARTSRSQGSGSSIRDSHDSWAFVHVLPLSYTIPFLGRSFESRCLARMRSSRQSSRARARSRAASISGVGARHLDHVPDGGHPGQERGVAPVSLDPVPGGPEHLAHGADDALDARACERPLQVEAGRAALVDAPRRRLEGEGPRGDRRRVVRERPLRDFAGQVVERRGRDRAGVHVETDAGTIDHGRDLL